MEIVEVLKGNGINEQAEGIYIDWKRYVCIYVCMSVCLYICMYVLYICMHVCMLCMYIFTICMYSTIHECAYVDVYV